MSDFKEILSQTKKQIKEVSVQEVRDKLNPDNGFTLLDVREGDEWEQGHLDKAIFLPRGFLEVKADKTLTDKQQPVVVYCAGGVRLARAAWVRPRAYTSRRRVWERLVLWILMLWMNPIFSVRFFTGHRRWACR